ncbi:MAG: hypothetical protein LBS01_04930 [Prevotellaceae bacterium]|jgi:chromosome segregation ATPase|nr:hypothetical protein [Prevotellaceae bacterium]
MSEFLIVVLTQVLPLLIGGTSLVGLLVERKKRKADTLKAIQDIYDEFVRDFSAQINQLKRQVAENKRVAESLGIELQKEKTNFQKLQTKYITLNEKYNRLKREFSDYKKRNNGHAHTTKPQRSASPAGAGN